MKRFEDYTGYGFAFSRHPLRFYASVAQANMQLGKQYLEAFKKVVDLSEKELETFVMSESVGDFLSRQKDIINEAVSSTGYAFKHSLDPLKNAQGPVEVLVTRTIEEREIKRRNKTKASASARAA